VRRAPALAILLALGAARPLAAQTVSLRVGGSRATYADSLSGSAASAGADVAWSGARTGGSLGAVASAFADGGWAVQGSGGAQRTVSSGARHQVALAADLSASAFTGGSWVGLGTAGTSAAFDAGPFVAGAALAAGAVRRLDGGSDPFLSATARLARSFAGGAWSAEAWGGAAAAGAVRYGDAAVGLSGRWRAVTLDARGGARFGDLGDEGWAQARAAVRVAAGVWLEAGGGRYPRDVTGFLHGTFFQAGLRMAFGGGVRAPAGPLVRRTADGGITARFVARDTGTVRIAGEWNGWRVEALEADGPRAWLLRAALAPGVYRFSLVRADGRWTVPEGVPTAADDFGGMVGLLVVPG
jgi:hypothetical protein